MSCMFLVFTGSEEKEPEAAHTPSACIAECIL